MNSTETNEELLSTWELSGLLENATEENKLKIAKNLENTKKYFFEKYPNLADELGVGDSIEQQLSVIAFPIITILSNKIVDLNVNDALTYLFDNFNDLKLKYHVSNSDVDQEGEFVIKFVEEYSTK